MTGTQRRLPPLNGLRAFEAAARHGNFVRAAQELNVTPAAISQQVRGLEAQLGVALFRRHGKRVSLTDAGQFLMPALSDGFDRMARATSQLKGGALKGFVTVSMLPSLANCWLAARLPDFLQRYPDIAVIVRSEGRRVDLLAGEADIGVRYGRGHHPGLNAELLMREEVFPVCAPSLLDGARALRRPRDLRQHMLLHDADVQSNEHWAVWDPWLKEFGVEDMDVSKGPRFTDSTTLYAVAMAGAGVALGRSAVVGDELRAGRLVRPFTVSHEAAFAYYIVTAPAKTREPRVAAFCDWMLAQARAFDQPR
ncbi:MAG: transcriptional regulator GcvA [Alphaproteobacteria bacterium]